MPAKKKSKTTILKKSVAEGNKAKTAFDKYKKRMDSFFSTSPGGMDVNQPKPLFNMLQPGAFPPSPSMMSYPHGQQFMAPGPLNVPPGTNDSLFQNIGNMLRLSVDLLNAGMQSGLQLIEGFSGHGAYCDEPYRADEHHHDACCSQSGHYDCCCDPCCDCGCDSGCECCCNPSVKNCP